MTHCKNCGQEVQQDWILCPKCGTQVKSNQQIKNDHNIIGIFLQIGGLCIFIVGILFSLFYLSMFSYNYSAYHSEDGPGLHGPAMIGSAMMTLIGFIMITLGLLLISKKVKFVTNKSMLKSDKEKLKLDNKIEIEKPHLNLGLSVALFGTTFTVIWGIILSFSDPAPLGFQMMLIIGFIITIVGVLLI